MSDEQQNILDVVRSLGLDESEVFRRSSRQRSEPTPRHSDADFDNDDDFDAQGNDSDYASDAEFAAPKKRKKTKKKAREFTPREHAFDAESSESESEDYSPYTKSKAAVVPSEQWAVRRAGSRVDYAEVGSDDDMSDDDRLVYEQAKAKAERAKAIDNLGEPPLEHRIEKVLDDRVSELNGEQVLEYYIKWMGWAYVHCTWLPEKELKQYKGFRVAKNYIDRMKERNEYVASLGGDALEEVNVARELARELVAEHCQVERILEVQESEEDGMRYLCKWRGLGYDECTLESLEDILPAGQAAIDAFQRHTQAQLSMRAYRAGRDRPKRFEPHTEQPAWFGSGNLVLRNYQLHGMNWLARNWTLDTNCILADEMGLGKTAQTLSVLGHMRYACNVTGPFLVVVPLSTITNWLVECQRWIPDFNVIMYIGNARAREIIRTKELWARRGKSWMHKFNVLLTTYEMVIRDQKHLSGVQWAYLAVDEAHRLKNPESQLYRVLDAFSTANRLLVTGTPLQNSLSELWALLHFLDRRKFASIDDFSAQFGELREQDEIARLHAELRPHILRRMKRDVEKSLPAKIERLLRVPLSPIQRKLYRWVLKRNFGELNRNAARTGKTSLLNVLMELKKVCNHPLLLPAGEFELRGADENAEIECETLIHASGKLDLLDRLLTRLREGGHRVLIFSQMVAMLDVLSNYMYLKGYPHQRLDGSKSRRERKLSMEHFNAPDSKDFCFLLSTRAGGLGINLASADTVVIFDSDYNPQNDLQAESRAHRIGQTKTVNIYRLLCKDTIEQDILERAKQKMVLDHLVIQTMDTSGNKTEKKNAVPFKSKELSAIIKFGAQNLFADDEQEIAAESGEAAPLKKSSNVDLDDILSRAEVSDRTNETSMADGLFAAFKVADFSAVTREVAESAASIAAAKRAKALAAQEAALAEMQKRELEDEEMAEDSDFWQRLIPESERVQADKRKKDEDPDAAMLAELGYVAPRKARMAVSNMNESALARRAAKGSSSGGAQSERGPTAREMKQRNTMTQKDVRMLLRGMMRFGWMEEHDVPHLNDIIEQGHLEAKDRELVLKTGGEIMQIARDTVAKSAAANAAATAQSTASAPPPPPPTSTAAKKPDPRRFEFRGESVNAAQLLDRNAGLAELHTQVVALGDNAKSFRLPASIRAPNFGVAWTPIDDAMLLIGIFKYGFGSWQTIRNAPQLRLTSKIIPNKPRSAEEIAAAAAAGPQPTVGAKGAQLSRRADTLLKHLRKSSSKKRKDAPTSKKSSLASSSAATKKKLTSTPTRAKVQLPGSANSKPAAKKQKVVSEAESAAALAKAQAQLSGDIAILEALRSTPNRKDIDKAEKRAKTLELLVQAGKRIDQVAQSDVNRRYLWEYVASFTPSSGSKMERMYLALSKKKSEK